MLKMFDIRKRGKETSDFFLWYRIIATIPVHVGALKSHKYPSAKKSHKYPVSSVSLMNTHSPRQNGGFQTMNTN